MVKLLIIEDELELLEGLRDILLFEGYDVYTALNGEDGLAKARDVLPQVIICDLLMPEMDGFEVIEQLKNNLSTSKIPIVINTALSERTNIRRAIELGANDYIVKPFTRERLLTVIEAMLTGKTDVDSEKQVIDPYEGKMLNEDIQHEFRTSLNVILGFGSIIEDGIEGYPEEFVHDMGRSISDEGKKLFDTIKKYMVFIDIEFNKRRCFTEKVDNVKNLVTGIFSAFARRYNRSGDLILELEEGACEIDHTLFETLLAELANNAFRFSSNKNMVNVKVKFLKDKVDFVVDDEGVGQPPEYVTYINNTKSFEPGIVQKQNLFALMLCKKIVSMHNGYFFIENNYSGGTQVNFSIPLTKDKG